MKGHGLGLRETHAEILVRDPLDGVDWAEVITEDLKHAAPQRARLLRTCARCWPR